ncbi:MAG: hypothetical protein NTU97_02745 [Candidatus Magasanikbacteria bacterium]|nr:hypothetical protein [Candidatus Magasanikbacteria bacterium]
MRTKTKEFWICFQAFLDLAKTRQWSDEKIIAELRTALSVHPGPSAADPLIRDTIAQSDTTQHNWDCVGDFLRCKEDSNPSWLVTQLWQVADSGSRGLGFEISRRRDYRNLARLDDACVLLPLF